MEKEITFVSASDASIELGKGVGLDATPDGSSPWSCPTPKTIPAPTAAPIAITMTIPNTKHPLLVPTRGAVVFGAAERLNRGFFGLGTAFTGGTGRC